MVIYRHKIYFECFNDQSDCPLPDTGDRRRSSAAGERHVLPASVVVVMGTHDATCTARYIVLLEYHLTAMINTQKVIVGTGIHTIDLCDVDLGNFRIAC